MKILVLNWRDPLHPEAGGAELHLDKIISYLAKKHQVVLVCTKINKKEEIFSYHGYEIRRIGHPFLFNFMFFKIWHKYLRNENFDVIIDDISKIGLQTPLYIKNIPIVSIFHHIHGHTLFQLLPFPVALYVYCMEKIALLAYKSTPMIVVSESSKKELLAFSNFQYINIIPNGIDKEYLSTRRIDKVPFQLCSVGRLTKAKRVDLAMDVFQKIYQQHPEARFIIAGKGSEEQYLKTYAQKLGIIDAVKFLGFVSDTTKKQLLEQSEAMLFTSEKEGWGITAIESSACSTPVFGFDVAGIRDSVQQGVNGCLVPFSDVNSLAIHLQEYLQNSQKQELQGRAYCYAKNFDWDKIVKEFEMFLYTII